MTATITTAPAATKFYVVWFSPRNFSNEGSYFHGTQAEAEQLNEDYDQYQSFYSFRSAHRTLAAAQAKAEKLARRDHRASPSHESCCISAAPFSDYLG